MKSLLSFLFLLLLIDSKGQFTESIETDRPDQTESPYTVPKNFLQFETGLNIERDKTPVISNTYLLHPTLLTKYGLGKKIELRFISSLSSNKTFFNNHSVFVTALEPLAAGFKLQLAGERGILPKTSLIFHTVFSQLATGYAKEEKFIAPDFRFTMQHSLSERISLGYNLGAEWDNNDANARWLYTLASGFNFGERWYGYAELFGFIQPNYFPQHNADGGFGYNINDNIKLDLSGGAGINPEAPDWYLALGFSTRFKMNK